MTPAQYLRQAMELAETARGRTSPNPLVGCVIVKDGRIIGAGCHEQLGGPHAERNALAAAGEQARGATLYCTLEPCCHHGRTPPCTDAILAAGVKQVIFAVEDPDPQVAGGGARVLREHGVEVQSGLLLDEATKQLAAYLHHRRTGRPYVTAKWAMTLDGKLATTSGDSQWVSGPAARTMVHRLRDQVDAVLVGSGTVLADNPSLTCRLAEFGEPTRETRNPLRIIVDTHGRVPPTAKVFCDGAAPTWWVTGEDVDVVPPGVEHLRVPLSRGRIDLAALLTELGRRGVVELLCEAGGTLTGALCEASLVHKVIAFVAPKLVGAGPTAWTGPGRGSMAEAVRLRFDEVTQVGNDVMLVAYVEDPASCSLESSRK